MCFLSPSVIVCYALALKTFIYCTKGSNFDCDSFRPHRLNSENSDTDSLLSPISACIDVVRMRHAIFLEQIVHLMRGVKKNQKAPPQPEKKRAVFDHHLGQDTPRSNAVGQKIGWCPSRLAQWSPGRQRRAGWPKGIRSTRPCAPTTECTDRCTFID